MSSRIAMSDLSAPVRAVVEAIACHYRIVPVAIDLNQNVGYVALLHNRFIHDPFGPYEAVMPFYIDRVDQRAIIETYARPIEPVSLPPTSCAA